MQEEFNFPLDAEQRERSRIGRSRFCVADAWISALIELAKAIRVNFYEEYSAGVELDWNSSVILKDLDDSSDLLPDLAIVTIYC